MSQCKKRPRQVLCCLRAARIKASHGPRRGMRWEISTGTNLQPINGVHGTECPGCRWENISSFHVGGAQVLWGDGAVRFLSENIDSATFTDLGSMNDGNVIGEF